MKIVKALLALLEDTGFQDQKKKEIRDVFIVAMKGMVSDPRGDTESNKRILGAALFLVKRKVESLYGVGDETELYPYPIFINQPQSQIAPVMNNHKMIALGVGVCAKSWEEVFYDLCHESLHLLNPVIDVKNNKVSALEEGCAVRFAEQMYEKYISPYCSDIPLTSPINSHSSQYFFPYIAAKKIPNSVLSDVRKAFGKFSTIDDIRKFKLLVGDYVDDKEIRTLVEPFIYK